MYFMGLSATRFLHHWPEMKKHYGEISLHNAKPTNTTAPLSCPCGKSPTVSTPQV
jgi:hypothetical protein